MYSKHKMKRCFPEYKDFIFKRIGRIPRESCYNVKPGKTRNKIMYKSRLLDKNGMVVIMGHGLKTGTGDLGERTFRQLHGKKWRNGSHSLPGNGRTYSMAAVFVVKDSAEIENNRDEQ